MDPIGAKPERRRFPRHRVRAAVLWCNRNYETMAGEICDVSAHGLFLVSRTALPDDVGISDRASITVRTSYGEETLVGVVRWRGYHPAHESIGCGIELDEPSQAILLRLFPVLGHQG